MKTNLCRRFKWYIVGFIMVVIMLSMGLSFCSWDNLSVQALNAKANAGEYYDTIELNEYVTLVVDKNGNKAADVGDIVTFGRYYQDAAQDVDSITILPEKTALRWIVVEIKGTTLTLLTENVVAFGSFWGTYYYNSINVGSSGYNNKCYQNYEQSTIRAWLNSNPTARNDGGPEISGSGAFAGFINEVFHPEEQDYITSQNITGIRGAGLASTIKQNYADIIGDKIWLPSYTQVYGNNDAGFSANDCSDGAQKPVSNTQFAYFTENSTRIAKTTAFASSKSSNYTWLGITSTATMNWQSTVPGGVAQWWLRSPYTGPDYPTSAFIVNIKGEQNYSDTDFSRGGVRPAVCVQL